PYRAALSYREQLQLFQTTSSYFEDLMARPGGPATYIGEFFTQFFNNFWIGAAVMTVFLISVMLLSYLICNRFAPSAPKSTNLALSIIPLISLLLFLGNPDVTLTFVVALSISLAGAYLFTSIKDKPTTAIIFYSLMIAGITLLYWLAGTVTIIFTFLIIAYAFKAKHKSIANKTIFATVSLICLAANVYIRSFFLPYPLSYQLIGIGYTMMPDRLDTWQIIVEALCVIVPILAALFARLPKKFTIPALISVEILAAIILYPRSYDKATYRLIDYDYMVRANDWEGILRYSDEHDPDLPLSVSATNLAAGMTGQLDCRAFDYYQHGTEGLIPPFAKETLSSWTTGEIFFQLGMVNSAQRFYFEGMEAIPNYNKSGRAVKRLAETAIIRGEYPLAKKYLSMLRNTIFYKKWAQRNLALIKNQQAVENHPLYGTLRRRMIDERYLFSESELDKTLGQLFLKDSGNNLAKQYLILYPLLQRDLNKFAQYMGVVADAQANYNPLLAQQAIAFISMKNNRPIPKNLVSPSVEQSLRNFAQAWTSKNPSLIEPYRRTLFHYLLSEE
ncbi:MAG: hypothetical protein K2I44_00760, partial [Muribaculaceae bacterium]|nr:hypothetical protein [Muribaculaceae bacterium]